MSSAPLSQVGGMIQSFHQQLSTVDSPAKLLYGFLFILVIVYSPVIPIEYRVFADSMLGRIFGIGIVYVVIESMGFVYGLLTAMAFLLILNGAPRSEGFDGGGDVTEKKTSSSGKRWFVERVLGETPEKIATDRVRTSAIESA